MVESRSFGGIYMRRLILIITGLLTVIFLLSCQDNEKIDIDQLLNDAGATLIYDEDIMSNIELPDTITYENKTIEIYWISSHLDIISQLGVVTRPTFEQGDVTVTLTAILTYQGKTHQKYIFITVLALPEVVPTTYTITFQSNGGSVVNSISNILPSSVLAEPSAPVKSGFTFAGWFTDELLLNPWNFETDLVTLDMTLYAKWVEVIPVLTYTVTFETNGGSSVAPYLDVEEGSFIDEPSSPTKDGYTFAGWFTSQALDIAFNFDQAQIESNITLYAKWNEVIVDPKTYTVTFVTLSDSVIEPYLQVSNNSIINEPETPSKDGYTFIGWYLDDTYSEIWDFEVDLVTSNITLYAKWEEVVIEIFYTVEFVTYTTDVIQPYTHVLSGTLINQPLPLEKEGYTFDGWYTESSYLNEWDFDTNLVTQDVILYAKWMMNEIVPEGTPISTQQEFYDLVTKNSTDSVYYLAKDIDFTGFTWTFVNYTFTKTLNGNGKTISNITINGADGSGVFSRVKTATIFNLHLDHIHVTSSGRAGILVGEVDGTDVSIYEIKITNSSVSGNSSNGVGGLIGKTKPTYITTLNTISLIGVSVTNASTASGGLIGMNEGGTITMSDIYFNDVYVQASNRAGGLFGEIKSTVDVQIHRVVMIDLEVTSAQYVGGLIGRNQSEVGISAQDIIINGSLQSTNKDFGHITGEKNIESVSNVYVVETTTLGTLNRQSVSMEYIISSLSTLTQSWWQSQLPNIANNPLWFFQGELYVLTGSSIPANSLRVTLVYGHDVADEVSYVKEGYQLSMPSSKQIEGYTFIGWFIDDTFHTPYDFNHMITEEMTLYALYEALVSYIVTILGEEYMVYENQMLTPPPQPSELGKIFDGWYHDDILFDFNQPITSSIVITVKWLDAALYTITFDSQGGNSIAPQSYYENQKIYQLPFATKDEYRFTGWYMDEDLTIKFSDEYVDSHITLYAKYSPIGEMILEENFLYTNDTHLRDTLWNEDKSGQLIVIDETLLMTELSNEAIYSTPIDTLVPGRYVLVFDFKQGVGGASFTIEMMNGTQRIFTVGANRANRYTYRNTDGSETAIASSLYSVTPNEWHQAIVVFDTEYHVYKYYVMYHETLIELTPQGGITFQNILDITSIRIRVVGHNGSPSSDPTTYLDHLLIESSSETEDGKSIYDPEPAINYEDLLSLIYDQLDIPFKDDVRDQLLLTQRMYNVDIVWESENDLVITNEGVVTRHELNDIQVIMNATFTKGDFTMNKEIVVTVKSLASYVSFDATDYGLSGFALGHVSIPNLREGDPGYYVVYTPQEFIQAIAAENSSSRGTTAARIIEVRADLDLGYLEVTNQYGPQPNVFLPHATPLLHPILTQTGVSKIVIQDRDGSNAKYHEGMMIFSESGHTIRHASFNIKRSNNMIIRNLKFDELWEWDEKTKGDYDSHDWDYFTIDTVNGIWFDHVELGKAYDGLIDFKAGSTTSASVVNATFSYLKLVFEPNAFILAQFEFLEANRQSYSYYNAMRNAGMSMQEIMQLNSYQKKGFLLGGSELRAGNVFTLTIYNSYIKNLQDRFPRLRGGDVHIFNTIYDATDVYNSRNEVRTLYPTLFSQSIYNRQLTNQALVTTENGAIHMENSIIMGVTQVIKSNQVGRDHPLMTGKYLVTDSLYILDDYVFYGSSLDENTAFIRSNSEPILPFSWNIPGLPYSNYRLISVHVLEEYLNQSILGTTTEVFDWLTLNYE